jgi:hypothetical protein
MLPLDFSRNLAQGFFYIFSERTIHNSGAQGRDSNLVVLEVPAFADSKKITKPM